MSRIVKKELGAPQDTLTKWLVGIVIAVGFVGLWSLFGVFIYTQSQDNKQLQAVSQECEPKGGDYDVYFDSVNGERTPVCRLPVTAEEQKAKDNARAYGNALRNGDIDPDEGDLSGFNEFPN